MEYQMQLNARLYFETYSNDEIIAEDTPLREYKSYVIDGPVLDVGCGQSAFLLEYARKGRKVVALDNEPLQLDLLKQRLLKEPEHDLNNWKFVLADFPATPLPNEVYSVIIFSNLLHFFTLEQCVGIGKQILVNTKLGSLIFIKVHSDKHYCNSPDDPERTSHFKHFFAPTDLDLVFVKEEFERIYLAQIDQPYSSEDKRFTNMWLDAVYAHDGYTDPDEIDEMKEEYFRDISQSEVVAIFRRR